MEIERIQGDKRHATLANRVADALSDGMEAGLEPEVAVCVAANVVADYWREMKLGPLSALAEVIQRTPERPSPIITSDKN